MRTTIELPDELMLRAKQRAAETGQTLKEFFILAVEEKLAGRRKVRRDPPTVGGTEGPPIGVLTAEQIDEALFG
jgi:hypothetical protein